MLMRPGRPNPRREIEQLRDALIRLCDAVMRLSPEARAYLQAKLRPVRAPANGLSPRILCDTQSTNSITKINGLWITPLRQYVAARRLAITKLGWCRDCNAYSRLRMAVSGQTGVGLNSSAVVLRH